MKKIELGQTISILANVGVIAGIIFLAVELRQNNELLAAEARANLADRIAGFIEVLMASPDLAEIITKAESGESLTVAERFRLDQVGRRLLSSFESQYVEVELGVISLETLPIRQWRAIFHGSAGRDYGLESVWEKTYRHEARPSFVAFVDQYIIEAGPP